MAKDDDEDLPDKDAAKGFYAKYEPKEILGRLVQMTFTFKFPQCQLELNIDEKTFKCPRTFTMYVHCTIITLPLMPLRNKLSKFLAIFRFQVLE